MLEDEVVLIATSENEPIMLTVYESNSARSFYAKKGY